MNILIRFLFLFFLINLWAVKSYAYHYTLMGGLSRPQGEVTVTPATTSTTGASVNGYGGGILAEADFIHDVASFEFGALYMPKGFLVPATLQTVSMNAVHIPVLVRVSWQKFVSFGVGGYYSYGIGAITSNPETPSYVYSIGSIASDDYGLVGSMSMKIKLFLGISIVADVRYLYGMSNISRLSEYTIYTRDIQGLVGIRFGD